MIYIEINFKFVQTSKHHKMKHEFIVRASSMGAIMTKPRSKSEILSETTKKEIHKTILFNKYGIEDEFSSKPTDKGIMNEPEGIKLASDVLGWFGIPEKKTRLINDWVTGEPDVYKKSILIGDIKNSFSGNTFPFFEFNEVPNTGYFWQMQSYMWLDGEINESELVYVLTNTPEQMVLDMIQKKIWKMLPDPQYSNYSPNEIEEMAEQHIRSQHNFDHIPKEKRIRKYVIQRDNDAIEQMKNQITLCRAYYDEVYSKI